MSVKLSVRSMPRVIHDLQKAVDKVTGAGKVTVGIHQAHAVYCMKQGMEPARMLEQLGAMAVGEVQKYVTELDTPPNAPSTIRQKGSSNPLINTGALRQSITYEVH